MALGRYLHVWFEQSIFCDRYFSHSNRQNTPNTRWYISGNYQKKMRKLVAINTKRRVRYRRVRYHINGEGRVGYHPMYYFHAIVSTCHDLGKISSCLIWAIKFLWQILQPKLSLKHALYHVISVRHFWEKIGKLVCINKKRRVRYVFGHVKILVK